MSRSKASTTYSFKLTPKRLTSLRTRSTTLQGREGIAVEDIDFHLYTICHRQSTCSSERRHLLPVDFPADFKVYRNRRNTVKSIECLVVGFD
ncbi:MAG TPA: hypothetical protein EYH59_03785 [Pyrodictium sp.]|nr:hypothetical protein [Pyrodictium sp.]